MLLPSELVGRGRMGQLMMCMKTKKPRKFMTCKALLDALQDGLEPEYMKPTKIIRNYKKLNTNKLHKRIER